MAKRYLAEVQQLAYRFTTCESIEDLRAFDFDPTQLTLLSLQDNYYTFKVRKKNGKLRTIEAPKTGLKTVQSQLNTYLQYVYFTVQTKASYGYIIRVHDVHP